MRAVLCGSPLDASTETVADISHTEMLVGQVFIPINESEIDPVTFSLAQDLFTDGHPPKRWYVRSGEMPDGTPRFVFACLSP
jgi:hypothetical protein